MPRGGHGRGAIAAIGLLLLFAGLVGGVVLWVLADREPEKAAESFARAAPGCTTTLTFGEAGTFYVYKELSGVAEPVEGCQPSTLPGRAFTFTIVTRDGIEVSRVEDTSQSYDLDVGEATSVARITIPAPGEYRISVVGDDPAVVAAVGGDPEEGVDDLRYGAIGAAGAGVLLGGLLLLLAGRRSKRAATFASPLDPGWGVTERDHQRRADAAAGSDLPAPVVGQVPVNPHAPDERRVAQLADPTPPTPPAAAHQPTLFDAPPADRGPAVAAALEPDSSADDGATDDAAQAAVGDDADGDGAAGDSSADHGDGDESYATVGDEAEEADDDAAASGDGSMGGGEPAAAAEDPVTERDVGASETEPVTEPVVEPAVDASQTDSVTEPAVDASQTDPVAEPVAEPAGDASQTDPVTEPVAEPAVDASDADTMPVSAPVPDDETDSPARGDADDASSDDDTPSA